MDDKVSARDIQRRLFFEYSNSSSVLCPNFTPARWFECDLFRVTKAGYLYEYEIKLSLSDFKSDFNKTTYNYKTKQYDTKHKMLESRHIDAPSKFFFVVPYTLTDKVLPIVPEWAGLLEYTRYLRQVKPSPNLHRNKCSLARIRQAKQSMMYRYWDMFLRTPDIHKLANTLHLLEEKLLK